MSPTKSLLIYLHPLPIKVRIEHTLSVICHSFFIGFSPICLSDLRLSVYSPKRIYALLTVEFYVSISCKQGQWGIAHLLFLPSQYEIHCLQNSDILILSTNLNQHHKRILLGNSIGYTLICVHLDVNHYI